MKNVPARLVVDLALAPYMDSCRLSTLIKALQITRARKTKLIVCTLSTRMRIVFEISQLTTVLTIFENHTKAVLA